MESANASATNNFLQGVAPITSDDVWAVGYYSEGDVFNTLAMHWDGRGWTITPTANPVAGANQLKKVIALASNDVWTVGGHDQGYVLRWNGSVWTQVPLPATQVRGFVQLKNSLEDIAAVAVNDIWIVGGVENPDGGMLTLTMHWDGAQWAQIPSPNVPAPRGGFYPQVLESVIALSANNVWAVGYYRVDNTTKTLVQRWDGSQWSIVPSPNGPSGNGWLHGLAAAGPNDIWAVGEYSESNAPGESKALALHWDGTTWTSHAPPNPSPTGVNPLHSIVARGPNDFYAVGSSETASEGLNTYALRWDGTAWTQISSENPSGDGSGWNPLLDVGTDQDGQLWAVGKKQADLASPNLTLVQRANLAPTALAMTSAVSRQVHGAAGAFDIALPTTGATGVECRLPSNGEYVIVFSFTSEVTAVDGVSFPAGSAFVSSRGVGQNPNEYVVRLTGVPDRQSLVVQLDGVRGVGDATLPSASARIDVLVGDANASRVVNASDIGAIKSNSGHPVTVDNFRADLTANGAINATDVAVVKGRSGGSL